VADLKPAKHAGLFLDDPNVRFPRQPRLVADLGIYKLPEGIGMQFRGGPAAISIRAPDAEALFDYLLPAMDGSRDLAALVAGRPAGLSVDTIVEALSLLHAKGLLADAANAADAVHANTGGDLGLRRQILFWGRNLGITGFLSSAEEMQRRIDSAPILLIATGMVGAATHDLLVRSGCKRVDVIDWDDDGSLLDTISALGHACGRAAHLATTSIDEAAATVRRFVGHAELVVTATRNAPSALLQEINAICLDRRRPVIFGNDEGSEFELGPYVLPHASACFSCKLLREASAHPNMLEEHVYQLAIEAVAGSGHRYPRGECIAAAGLIASHIVLETIRVITGAAPPTLLNSVQVISPLHGAFESHPVRRVPRCPACSRGSELPQAMPSNESLEA
jgi:molybdopterin-synthase adenylyltransferase